MPDILIRNVPSDLKRQIEERARGHKRSLSLEINTLLESALAHETRPQIAQPAGALGTKLASLVSEEDWTDAFIQPRDNTERGAPTFE
jgi:plasmid stability protein